MTTSPVNVTVTGAAGQIGYALLFRIASGQLLGSEVPVRLRLLEVPQAVRAAEGTALELADCAFPLLNGVEVFDDATKAFAGTNVFFQTPIRSSRVTALVAAGVPSSM